jgi:hypothetical protein
MALRDLGRECPLSGVKPTRLRPMAPRGSKDRHDRSLLKVEQRAPVSDVRRHIEERDQRLANDQRSDVEKWLGDPPPERSALAAKEKS